MHLAILPRLAVDRPDIDDPAPAAFAHAGKHRLRHVKAAAEIDVDDFLPHLVGHLQHDAVAGDAGVVDQHIDRAEIVDDPGDAALPGLWFGHVPLLAGKAVLLGDCTRLLVLRPIDWGKRHAGPRTSPA